MQLKITEKDLAYDPAAQAEAIRRMRGVAPRATAVPPRSVAPVFAPPVYFVRAPHKGKRRYRHPIGPRQIPRSRQRYAYPIGPVLPVRIGAKLAHAPAKKHVAVAQLEKLMREVAVRHCVTALDLASARRHKPLIAPRREFCFRAKKLGASLPLIGRVLGGRDHTTILHSIRRYKETARGATL